MGRVMVMVMVMVGVLFTLSFGGGDLMTVVVLVMVVLLFFFVIFIAIVIFIGGRPSVFAMALVAFGFLFSKALSFEKRSDPSAGKLGCSFQLRLLGDALGLGLDSLGGGEAMAAALGTLVDPFDNLLFDDGVDARSPRLASQVELAGLRLQVARFFGQHVGNSGLRGSCRQVECVLCPQSQLRLRDLGIPLLLQADLLALRICQVAFARWRLVGWACWCHFM